MSVPTPTSFSISLEDNGLVPVVEPKMLLDGSHGIERTFEVVQKVWAEVFFHLAENNVMFEGILLSPLALNAQRKPHRNRLPSTP